MEQDSGRVGDAETGSHPSGQDPQGLGAARFDPARWIAHNLGPQPQGLEDCTVDAVGTDGSELLGFWPHNIVWRNVTRYRVRPEQRTSQPDKLVTVLAALYASEINCGIESFWDGGFTAFLGDATNGWDAEITLYPNELDGLAEWFSHNARRLYPASDYAIAMEAAQAGETPKSGSTGTATARACKASPRSNSHDHP